MSEEVQEVVGKEEEPVVQQDENEESWVTSSVLEEASTYGLNAKDLEEFTSEDEFHRAGRLLDLQATRFYSAEQPGAPAEEEDKEEEFKPPIDIDQLRENDYDDHSISMGEAINEIAERNYKAERRLANEKKKSEEKALMDQYVAFHKAADELDPEFYGQLYDKDGNLNELSFADNSKRAELFNAWRLVSQTQPEGSPITKAIIARADRLAFDESRESKKEAARTQSRKRRTVGSSSDTPTKPNQGTPEAVADSPEIMAFWRKAMRENGEL